MRNADLHGNAPDKSRVALLLIDLINDLEFPGGEQLLQHALPAARRVAELKRRATEAEIPVSYVNDNRDFHLIVPDDCTASIRPEDNRHALEQMERVLKADIRPSGELDLAALKHGSGEH